MIDDRTERTKWLLNNVKHAAMATVNADSTPHNTPYFFMRSDDLSELYWSSNPKSLHSQNIERTGNVFIVLYEAHEGGGLYIKCRNARIAEDFELGRALAVHNKLRQKYGKNPLQPDYYLQKSGQKMYIAEPETFWINYTERDEDGRIVEDKRRAISKNALRAN